METVTICNLLIDAVNCNKDIGYKMKAKSEDTGSLKIEHLYCCKRYQFPCEVRVTNTPINKSHFFFACYCTENGSIFRAWCDEVHLNSIHVKQPQIQCEDCIVFRKMMLAGILFIVIIFGIWFLC